MLEPATPIEQEDRAGLGWKVQTTKNPLKLKVIRKTRNEGLLLTMVLYLSSFSLGQTSASPHQPRNLTWMVINDEGDVWSTSKVTTPNQWWPDLFPDICRLAVGASGWDLEGHSDSQKVPVTCASDEWTHRRRA